MANSVVYKEAEFKVGDTVALSYRIVEGEKERTQLFRGILLKITGNSAATRTVTIRKISKIGIGVEKIVPLASQNIVSLKLVRQSNYQKSKLYFIRDLTESAVRNKLYRAKK